MKQVQIIPVTKVINISMGNDIILEQHVTTQPPENPTAENYRYDIKYNSRNPDPNACEVEFFDVDKNEWSRLSGHPADNLLLQYVLRDDDLNTAEYVYYTVETVTPEVPTSTIIDVTPN